MSFKKIIVATMAIVAVSACKNKSKDAVVPAADSKACPSLDGSVVYNDRGTEDVLSVKTILGKSGSILELSDKDSIEYFLIDEKMHQSGSQPNVYYKGECRGGSVSLLKYNVEYNTKTLNQVLEFGLDKKGHVMIHDSGIEAKYRRYADPKLTEGQVNEITSRIQQKAAQEAAEAKAESEYRRYADPKLTEGQVNEIMDRIRQEAEEAKAKQAADQSI